MAFSRRSHEKMNTQQDIEHTYPFRPFGAVKRTFWKSAFVIPGAFRWRLTSPLPSKPLQGCPFARFLPTDRGAQLCLQPTWFALKTEALIAITSGRTRRRRAHR